MSRLKRRWPIENLLLKTNAESRNELKVWREQLDEINQKILYLIAERQKVARKIGEWKRINHLPIVNFNREVKLLGSILDFAVELKLDIIEVMTIFCALLRLSKEEQK